VSQLGSPTTGRTMGVLTRLSAVLSKSTWTRYTAALASIVLALLTRWALNPVLADSVPYVILFPAVAFSAYFCGVGPSVAAVIVGLEEHDTGSFLQCIRFASRNSRNR
jgi:hypothetical protein